MPFPISEAEIARTEAKTGFTFPTGMKARLMKDNGGEVEAADDDWQLIPFLDSSDRKRLARTCNDIVRETQGMRGTPSFPAHAFVVAQDGGGNYLILLPKSGGSRELGDEVYLWDHETGEYEVVGSSLDSM